MVDALNRLDQTDALVEQIIGDRAEVEQSANRGHVHSNYIHGHPLEAEVPRAEPNHYPVHGAESDSESEQLDWDPERVDDDGYPLVDENGSTLVLVPRDGPLDEAEANSLSAWAQGYREVRGKSATIFRHRTWLVTNPSQMRFEKKVRKTLFTKRLTKTRSKRPHTISRGSERTRHRTYHRSRTQKAYSLLPMSTTWTLGERVSDSSTKGGRPPGTSENFLHARLRFCTAAQSCFLHGVRGCV